MEQPSRQGLQAASCRRKRWCWRRKRGYIYTAHGRLAAPIDEHGGVTPSADVFFEDRQRANVFNKVGRQRQQRRGAEVRERSSGFQQSAHLPPHPLKFPSSLGNGICVAFEQGRVRSEARDLLREELSAAACAGAEHQGQAVLGSSVPGMTARGEER